MTEKRRVAIVVLEQNTHVQELISDVLTEAQFAVVSLNDGYAALDHARKEPPALIITEVLTPRLDGLSLCRLLKREEATRNTKILVLSVFAIKERALAAGADAFLLKPIENKSLVATVRSLIEPSEPKPQ